jgi:uncharacterized membrane protein
MSDPGVTPQSAHDNIETVARMEQQFLESRDFKDRLGDRVANFVGTMTFVICHIIGFFIWAVVNSGSVGIKPFDPYPYVLLTMLVSMEGVLVSTFVLMKQNRMSRRADQRDHLNLQVDLLAEKEITKMLQLQRMMCAQMGIREAEHDQEVLEMSQHTAVDELAHQLENKLPGD